MGKTKKQLQNQAQILDQIYTKGPISRIDIANETSITPATVSAITSELIDEGLVEEIGEEVNGAGSGRRKILLDIKADHSYYIGLELSEKFISFCLSDNKGNIIKEYISPIEADEREQKLQVSNVVDELTAFRKQVQSYDVKAVGVALPGHYHANQELFLTNNPLWKQFDLKQLEDGVDVPVYFENNVKCMLIYERLFSDNKTDENFVFFHISRGIFCAYMYNGKPYAQENHLVGEIGHTIVQVEGELCECGNRGCLQTLASEAWLIKRAQLIYDYAESSYIRHLVNSRSDITMETLLMAYHLGDLLIKELLENAVRSVATSIINLSMIVDTQTIYVHGSLYNEKSLVALLNDVVSKRVPLFNVEKNPALKVVPYREINGAIGACSLCISRTLTEA